MHGRTWLEIRRSKVKNGIHQKSGSVTDSLVVDVVSVIEDGGEETEGMREEESWEGEEGGRGSENGVEREEQIKRE